MERLAFSFYHTLRASLAVDEAHFAQLARDYTRESRNEELVFAIDFAELYNVLHAGSKDANRAEINEYIVETLDDSFSLLPGAVGELFSDLEKNLPDTGRTDYGDIYINQAVADFINYFENVEHDETQLIDLYAGAESYLRKSLGIIFDMISPSEYSFIRRLKDLLELGKFTPIEGVKNINPLTQESLSRMNAVLGHLNLSRPDMQENNQIDAIDFMVAFNLNQQGDPGLKQYITIYSQAKYFLEACRSHNNLRWDNDYLIREADYLQLRAKIQDTYNTLEKRIDYVNKGTELSKKLVGTISELVDIDEKLEEGAVEPSLKFLDHWREYDEEYRQPLMFEAQIRDSPSRQQNAREWYKILKSEELFMGDLDSAIDVLKEHLRFINGKIQAFVPANIDTEHVKRYKADLCKWLKLNE